VIKAMCKEVAKFTQCRFGELKVSEARCEGPLSEADEHYPKYLEVLKQLIYTSPSASAHS
jgi:hypothetical protein